MTDDMKIEKGVPVAPKRNRGTTHSGLWAVLFQMEVGDSVYVNNMPQRVSTNVSAFAKHKGGGVKFITRKEGRGTRVWRTE